MADAFLAALAPGELDALARARQAQQQVNKALRAGAERELERKRYAAALAERQFNRVDPDNRLVASELERRWEAALSELRAAEDAVAQRASTVDARAEVDRLPMKVDLEISAKLKHGPELRLSSSTR
ncbi:hypothetical protein RLV_2043 (plasmid) [Rhizobium leguminosarum bv. viciae]|nr:hypothetical protein RLV_2043 [Rhizobium leguminosarum bv. viciae]